MTEETTAAEEPQEKPIYGNVSIEELEKPEYDEDQVNEFMALYEESISGIKEGQIVKGTTKKASLVSKKARLSRAPSYRSARAR